MSAHTKGPWRVGGPTEYTNQVSIEPAIGCVYGAGDEVKANANLIAAAPELLTACHISLSYLEAVCFNTPNPKKRRNYADAAAILHAAIAKATGAAA